MSGGEKQADISTEWKEKKDKWEEKVCLGAMLAPPTHQFTLQSWLRLRLSSVLKDKAWSSGVAWGFSSVSQRGTEESFHAAAIMLL